MREAIVLGDLAAEGGGPSYMTGKRLNYYRSKPR
jgi:hypothetical protein